MFCIARAELADCEALARTSKTAFEEDVEYRKRGLNGPPGYDSGRWYALAFKWGCVLKVLLDEITVGGAIVVRNDCTWMELGRFWLIPGVQGMGLGREMIYLMEAKTRPGTLWTVDAPVWSSRSIRLCQVCGYREVGRASDAVFYEKRIAPPAPGAK